MQLQENREGWTHDEAPKLIWTLKFGILFFESAHGPVLLDRFLNHPIDVDVDCISDGQDCVVAGIMEHIEEAGVHSGDATLILPAQGLYVETIRQIKAISAKIAQGLHISGPFNIQYMARDNFVKVIECNLRSSRTFPFASKTFKKST